MKKSVIFALTIMLTLMLAVVVLPEDKTYAKAKCWYGKYCEYKETAKKAVRIKGHKVYIKGKWENMASRYDEVKAKKVKKTFRLTKKTKYYIEDDNAETAKRVSQKKFKKNLYSDLCYISFKVKSGKVVRAIVSLN